ncbi:MAG: hypothetical protein KF724_04455 [Phycisphaeraceae bacterium]|nr:hypothetical protein [Phycisphaeraceae bacterium]
MSRSEVGARSVQVVSTCKSRRGAIAATIASIAACTGLAGAQADGVDFWEGPTHYLHVRANMPDLDQMRAINANCALPPFPGIPTPGGACAILHPGGMHCGPTAGTNLYIYAANHGYPGLLPANQLGDIWRQPAFFCAATAHIGKLGQWSGWSLQGTSTKGMMQGLNTAFRVNRQPLVASHYLATGVKGLNLNQLAATGMSGALVMVAYGHYQVVGFMGTVPVVQRNGGHFVVMTGAYRNDPICKLRIRDPADDGCNPVLGTQAEYKQHVYNAGDMWVRIFAPGFPARWMTRIFPENQAPNFVVGSTLSLLDGMTIVRPRTAIGKIAPAVPGQPPQFVKMKPQNPWAPNGGGGGNGGMVCEPIDFGVELVGAARHPDGRGIIGLIKGNGVAGADSMRSIVIIDPVTGQNETLADIDGAEHMVVGRNRAIYVVAGQELHRVELPLEAEIPLPDGDDDFGSPPTPLKLPFEVSAIEFNDFTDEVMLLSSDGLQVAILGADDEEVTVYAVPEGASPGEGGAMAANPLDGVIWYASATSTSLFGLAPPDEKRAGVGPLELAIVDEIELPKSTSVVGINFLGDDEVIISTAASEVIHLERSPPEADGPTGWKPVIEGAFEAACQVAALDPERPRGNFVPGEHDQPPFDNFDPGVITPGRPIPDPPCIGDLNMDGIVDGQDLALLLSVWGPIPPMHIFEEPFDIVVDRVVNGADLAYILGNWGPCPTSN